jgi:hypothetical protein
MVVPSSITLKFSILIITLLAFEASDTIAIGPMVIVTIVNKVQAPTPTTITVDCKSDNVDHGSRTIGYGDIYLITFQPEFSPNEIPTLLSCSFTWPQNLQVHYLDIYDQNRHNCNDCTWGINVNGGCLNDQKCVLWKSIQLMDAYNTSN